MATLYERLRLAEEAPKKLIEIGGNFQTRADYVLGGLQQHLNEAWDENGAVGHRVPDCFIPDVPVGDIQRKMILADQKNQVLFDAVRNKRSVVQTVDELRSRYSGIWKYLPKRENLEHNHEVRQLGELVIGTDQLETRGLLAITDNVIIPGGFVAGMAFGLGATFSLAVADYAPDSFVVPALRYALPTAVTALFTSVAAMSLCKLRKQAFATSREQAQYIDSKIKELL